MLQPAVIEDLARKAIDRVLSGAKSEDSLIELKRELPDPRKAARQIAALCIWPAEDAVWAFLPEKGQNANVFGICFRN